MSGAETHRADPALWHQLIHCSMASAVPCCHALPSRCTKTNSGAPGGFAAAISSLARKTPALAPKIQAARAASATGGILTENDAPVRWRTDTCKRSTSAGERVTDDACCNTEDGFSGDKVAKSSLRRATRVPIGHGVIDRDSRISIVQLPEQMAHESGGNVRRICDPRSSCSIFAESEENTCCSLRGSSARHTRDSICWRITHEPHGDGNHRRSLQ